MASRFEGARKLRNPVHTFNLKCQPFALQPMLLAPVLPGETLKHLLVQARVVTDPIKSPIIGWWSEMYFFYVKHRDLDDRELLQNIMLDASLDLSTLQESYAQHYYSYANAVNWSKHCLKRVVEEYFRHADEAWNIKTVDGLPMASIVQNGFWDSLTSATEEDDGDVTINTGDGLTAAEVDLALQQWQLLRMQNLTQMTYEDYLRSYGVKGIKAEEDLHRPELIRYIREWQYPSNTIDPSTGAPSSAVSLSHSERADKDRFFKEPGFVFGVYLMRPKVYMRYLRGSAAGALQNAYSWLPPAADPMTAIQKSAAGTGVFQSGSEVYWWDRRDLFLYGDQFHNHLVGSGTTPPADRNFVDLPFTADQAIYVDATEDIPDFFADSTKKYVHVDGRADLAILGHQWDMTPNTIGSPSPA